MRKSFFILLSLLAFQACKTKQSVSSTEVEQQKKPNIIFLFADDQCFETTAANGNTEIRTPHLDKLAKSGVNFSHAYNMGAWTSAVCQASRTMLNTGRFVWNANKLSDENYKQLVEDRQMWSQMMEDAGYETYMSGKWHVKVPSGKVFNHVQHERPGMPKDAWVFTKHTYEIRDAVAAGKDFQHLMPNGYARPKDKNDKSWLPWDRTKGGYWEGGKHWSEVLADDAIAFIDAAKNKENPYFMYLAFNAGHDPRQSPKEYVDIYPVENISTPKSFQPEYPNKVEIGCGPSVRDEALAPFPRTEYSVKVHKQEYYAILSHMDAQIGRIIQHLKETNQLENTYIFYTADHGLAMGKHGLLGKQNLYDHSVRVPLYVIGPNIPQDKKLDMDVYLQDVMASTLDLANYEKPEYVEFNSLMPLIEGTKEKSYDAIYGAYLTDLQRMIRTDDYKLLIYPKIKKMYMFDLKKDKEEMVNLADLPEYQEKKAELFAKLVKLQKEMNDPLDLQAIFTEI